MNKEENKIDLVIGTETPLTPEERKFFEHRFNVTEVSFKDMLSTICRVDLIYFSGGEDVTPGYYNESVGKYTHYNTKRDKLCENIFSSYYHIPKLGICRGAQFLTVFSGGKLIQHVEGHTKEHPISLHYKGLQNPSNYNIPSTHHQMMYPYDMNRLNYNLLAWSTYHRSLTYLNGEDKEIELPNKFLEPEIIFYRKTRSLAIQGHPEYSTCNRDTVEACLNLISNFLL